MVLGVAACATSTGLICHPGEQSAIADTMYFGTAKPGGIVTSDEWKTFVNRVVTPRFPQGLTMWEASGQWRTATGTIEREASHVLHLIHPDTDENELVLHEVMSKYKTEFQQEAVLRVRSSACTSY
jgi:hypothetical protein